MNAHDIQIHEGPACISNSEASGLPTPESLAPPEECPDARIYLNDGECAAHAALWWKETPEYEGGRVGAIGGFAASDASSAFRLLEAAGRRLAEAGCRIVVGPMNGNTWRKHRFVIEGGGGEGRGSYFFEPRNPAPYPEWWRQAGFGVLSRYSSSRIELDGRPTVPAGLKERIERSGVVIRPIDTACYDEELRRIHAISLKSFSSNFLYTPLDEEAFIGAYRKARGLVDANFVRIAERGGVPVGFVFCICDVEAKARGEPPALIVKTLAVDPGARSAGLGSLLVDEVQRAAYAVGYRESIHALQHESNTSLKITGRQHGCVFRRYALLAKRV